LSGSSCFTRSRALVAPDLLARSVGILKGYATGNGGHRARNGHGCCRELWPEYGVNDDESDGAVLGFMGLDSTGQRVPDARFADWLACTSIQWSADLPVDLWIARNLISRVTRYGF
jgi:hypothetical protein